MDLINILIIVSTVVLLLVLWIVVGVRHLQHLKIEIKDQWELLDESLRKRQDLLPNLIETARIYFQDREELIEKLVVDRHNAALEYFPGAKKIELEHELSMSINKIMDLAKQNAEFAKDTNFLELKTEIEDLENNIELKSRKYNEMVRYFNNHRDMFMLKPIAAIFGFGMMNIFEVEV